MSDPNPPEPTVEIIGGPEPEPVTEGRGGRRGLLVGIIAVVAVLLGGAAFGIYQFFFAGGPQPEEALPASTIAVVSIDLDPSAGQKIAAIRTIRKFPALKDELGLGTRDDLRKFIFDKATDSTGCDDVSYADDVKPWIGQRAAFAAVDLDGKVVPAVVLKVDDQDKAKKGVEAFADCVGLDDDFGFAIGDDYLIASDSTAHAEKILDEGAKKSLADNASYQKWSDKVGDKGVVNFYVAKNAVDYISDALDDLQSEFLGGSGESFGEGSDGMLGESAPPSRVRTADDCSDDAISSLKDQFKDFDGAAGTIRFAGGGMELSVVGSGLTGSAKPVQIGKKMAALPEDSAIALGFGVSSSYADNLVNSLQASLCESGTDPVAEAEQTLGVKLPDDLKTLLGEGLTLSLGGKAPEDLGTIDGLADIPVGLVIHGDGQKIKDLINKLETNLGASLADIQVGAKSSDDRIVLTPSQDYADALLENGSLGKSSSFTDAVPEADKALAVLYVNFNSAWRDTLVKLIEDEGGSASDARDARDNTEPLKSLGLSAWQDGSTSHFLFKLSTD